MSGRVPALEHLACVQTPALSICWVPSGGTLNLLEFQCPEDSQGFFPPGSFPHGVLWPRHNGPFMHAPLHDNDTSCPQDTSQ